MHKGQYGRISITSSGSELEAEISGPNPAGPKLWVAPSETRHLALVSNAEAQYRVRISAAVRGDVGSYAIEMEEVRDATSHDSAIAQAEAFLRAGQELARKQKEESYKQAVTAYRSSLDISRAEHDPQLQAEALNAMGEAFSYLSEYPSALTNFTEALTIWKQAGDLRGQAIAADNIGGTYYNLGDRTQGIKYLRDSLEISKAASFPRGEAAALNDIGVVSLAIGNYKEAVNALEKADQLYKTLGDQRLEAQTLVSIGVCYQSMGIEDSSIEAFQRALPVIQLNQDKFTEAIALNDLANSYSRIGEKQEALNHYLQALRIEKEEGDKQTEADTLNNIGNILDSTGDHSGAVSHYDEALNLAKVTGDRQLEMVTDVYKASVAEEEGEFAKALDLLERALVLSKSVDDRRWQATALNNTARIHARQGDSAKALELYSQGLTIDREIGDKPDIAITVSNIADLHLGDGRLEEAEKDYNEALETGRAVGSPEAEEAALYGLARLKDRQNDLEGASQLMQRANGILESLRTKIQGDIARATYAASKREQFEFSLELEMRLEQSHPGEGHIQRAFELVERSRARGLMDLLRESGVNIREGVSSELVKQERFLAQQINRGVDREFKLGMNNKHDDELHSVRQHVDDLQLELQGVEDEIRRASPRYAALTQPPFLSVHEFQNEQLDPDTTLIEYALGKRKSYVFVVSQGSIVSREIPNREHIEGVCHRLYQELTAPNQIIEGESPSAHAKRLAKAEYQVGDSARALSEMVLFPVAEQLTTQRLIVVSDGALQYIPFGILSLSPEHGTTKDQASLDMPLLSDREIVNLPSASALTMLGQGARRPRDNERGAVAVLADPVFSRDDPRLQRHRDSSGTKATQPSITASRESNLAFDGSLRDAGLRSVRDSTLARLPFTRMEADAIRRLAPQGTVWESLDFQANRQTALSGRLSRYRIVHFATHGLLDSTHPELSGLVFSLVDPTGRPTNGFLSLEDIYNLSLPVDLVVLSGCETGLGKEIDGEGLIGLTRGFMYAGTPSVVASLWKVEDSATAELMERFYRKLLQDHDRPAAALRAAQLEMKRDKHWSAPYNWAAFTFQGQWR
jgi:CHAT domain-containing protein/tetratricopeptide (TPR) repeat protein